MRSQTKIYGYPKCIVNSIKIKQLIHLNNLVLYFSSLECYPKLLIAFNAKAQGRS